MGQLKFELERASLEIVNTSLIRPILENGGVVFDMCQNHTKDNVNFPLQSSDCD